MPIRPFPALAAMTAALALPACNQNTPTNTEAPTEAGATMAAEPVATTSPGAAALADETPGARGTGAPAETPAVDPAAPQDPAR